MNGDEERIEIGADVVGADGEKLGSVAYVVVHPPDMRLADIVVSTGAILGRDVVVPIGTVDRIADGKVNLSISREQLQACRDYVEVDYRPPPTGWIPTSGFAYPAQATLWPADMYYPQITGVRVNAPPNTVGLHEGMDVESSDGEKVGSIASVDTDPSTETVTGIVIRQGLLFKHDIRIPINDVADVSEERVTLKRNKDEL